MGSSLPGFFLCCDLHRFLHRPVTVQVRGGLVSARDPESAGEEESCHESVSPLTG